jgi:hypothetical protein
MWRFDIARAMAQRESSPTLPSTMPFGRRNHQHIDEFRNRPYIAGHEQVAYDPDRRRAPPPYRHGTAARSRVKLSVPLFRGTFPQKILSRIRPHAP